MAESAVRIESPQASVWGGFRGLECGDRRRKNKGPEKIWGWGGRGGRGEGGGGGVGGRGRVYWRLRALDMKLSREGASTTSAGRAFHSLMVDGRNAFMREVVLHVISVNCLE